MELHDGDLPVATCARCAREVLVHLEWDGGDEPQRRCVHCDAVLPVETVRWVGDGELDGLGYAMRGEGRGGCGRSGCGSGGCGRG